MLMCFPSQIQVRIYITTLIFYYLNIEKKNLGQSPESEGIRHMASKDGRYEAQDDIR